jgi:Transposase DDE domain group 1
VTECTAQKAVFAKLHRKSLEADFSGGRLTSDGGALLLREADRACGLSRRLADLIPDSRDPARVRHSMRELLGQRTFAIALGYEDLNDHNTLRDDAALQAATGRDPAGEEALASAPTLCRLENGVGRTSLAAMSALLVELFIESHREAPSELVLDFDATDDPLHGEQEGRFFHGYYDGYCYLPLYVFCEDRPLVAYLRPSNIDPSLHSRAILKMLVRRLREAWPQVKIIMRADSGFCRWRLMRWCERHGVDYILGLATNKRLQAASEPLMAEAEALFTESGQKVRHFGEVLYGAKSWDRQRRVICKAERLEGGPNRRYVVTTLAGDARHLYDGLYCRRGEMENRIKEQQLQLFADRTSCHRMLANQFRLLLSTFAYVLVELIRRVALAGTEMARAQVGTIRLKLFKVGARVAASGLQRHGGGWYAPGGPPADPTHGHKAQTSVTSCQRRPDADQERSYVAPNRLGGTRLALS